jgi:hypothetical protein
MGIGPALVAEPAASADADVALAVEPVSLVLVCAWCGQPIGRAAAASRRIISHGMCRPCLEDMLAAEGRAFAASGR